MKEKLAILLLILTTLLLASSPFIYGQINTPLNSVYLGTHYSNYTDTFAYLGLFTQAKREHFLFFNPYSPEKHSALFFRPLFSFATVFLKIIPLTSVEAYHFFRILLGLILLLILFYFLKTFFPNKALRCFVYTNLVIGSGLGWLSISFIKDPMDLWVPETNIFLSLMEAPHFVLSLSLMLTIFMLWMKNSSSPSSKTTLLASIAAVILFLCHPFDAPIIYLTLFLYIGYLCITPAYFKNRKILITLFILFLLISSLPLLWQTYQIQSNFIAAYWSKQNINLSPSPLGMIFGLGIWLPLAVGGIILAFKNKNTNFILIALWALSYFPLTYIPLNIQRRFLEGLFIPYIILSCYFLNIIIKKMPFIKKHKTFYIALISIFIFINSFSNILILKRDFVKLNQNKQLPFYLSKYVVNGLNWLENQDSSLKTFIGNWEISYISPTYLYCQTFWGHKVQTINLSQKEKEIKQLFNNKLTRHERKIFFHNYNLNYLIWEKRDTTKPYKPENDSYLKKIYSNPKLTIYKII